MKIIEMKIEDKLDELMVVLDEDVRYIQQNISYLNELRSLVIKRDDSALSKLLERIQSEADRYRDNEKKRQSIRKEVAIALGCDPGEITLSRLEDELTGEKKARIGDRKIKLRELVVKLKQEHISTALLLSECVRFNNILLKSIFRIGENGTVTYTNNGAAKRQNDTMFVNMRF